ncbi:MAG: DUF4238 domain-containing protein [Spirochaetaceae bacterium]
MINKDFRHHYVPQWLIKKFCKDDHIPKNDDDFPVSVYDCDKSKSFNNIPRRILYKKYLNSIDLNNLTNFIEYLKNNGEDVEIFKLLNYTAEYEHIWERFDRITSMIYNIIDNKTKITIDDRANISFFFSGSYFRTLKIFKRAKDKVSTIRNLLQDNLRFTESEIDTYLGVDSTLDDEKYSMYKFLFENKDTFQYFTDYLPIVLYTKSEFILGDNPVILLNFYHDNINNNGLANEGTFAVTPIDKHRSILMLPTNYLDMILNNYDLAIAGNILYDNFTGEEISNSDVINKIDYIIKKLFSPESIGIPLVQYKCNIRDVEFLNYLQIANCDRFLISSDNKKEMINNYFTSYPELIDRNNICSDLYIKTGSDQKIEIFQKIKNNEIINEKCDFMPHVYNLNLKYTNFSKLYRTIIYKIQKIARVSINPNPLLNKEHLYGNKLYIEKK